MKLRPNLNTFDKSESGPTRLQKQLLWKTTLKLKTQEKAAL